MTDIKKEDSRKNGMHPMVTVILVVGAVAITYLVMRQINQNRLAEQERSLTRHFDISKQKSVRSSRGKLMGTMYEELASYMPGFPYHPKDVRRAGDPMDLLVYNGLEAGKIESIVFMDVKANSPILSKNTRMVKEALSNNVPVRFETYILGRHLNG